MKRILLVEDNSDNRDLVFAFLDAVYDVEACVDGFEALQILEQGGEPPDIILCDISLPGMDGVELLRKIRTRPALKDTPAIALTSHAMKGDQERFLAAGFDAYVSKPILDDSSLIDPIERLIAERGA